MPRASRASLRLAAVLLLLGGVRCVCVRPRLAAPPDASCDLRWSARAWLWRCVEGRRVLVIEHTCEGPCPPWYSRRDGPCGTPLPEEERFLGHCRPGPGNWPY